jgi:hypothetical protein
MKWRAIAIPAALACLGLAGACAGASPSSVVKAFYQSIGKGDADAAIGLLSEQAVSMVDKAKLRAGLQQSTREVIEKGGLSDVQIVEETVTGDVAEVTALLKFGNGTQERVKNHLIKERGVWRIRPTK